MRDCDPSVVCWPCCHSSGLPPVNTCTVKSRVAVGLAKLRRIEWVQSLAAKIPSLIVTAVAGPALRNSAARRAEAMCFMMLLLWRRIMIPLPVFLQRCVGNGCRSTVVGSQLALKGKTGGVRPSTGGQSPSHPQMQASSAPTNISKSRATISGSYVRGAERAPKPGGRTLPHSRKYSSAQGQARGISHRLGSGR